MARESQYLTTSCTFCGGGIEFPAEGIGEQTACPHCGNLLTLAKPGARFSKHGISVISLVGIVSVVICFMSARQPASLQRGTRQALKGFISVSIREIYDFDPKSVSMELEVYNGSDYFVSSASFTIHFIDSWGKTVTEAVIVPTTTDKGGMKPHERRRVVSGASNFNSDRIAKWEPRDGYVKIQLVEGQDTEAEFAIITDGPQTVTSYLRH